MSERKLNGIDFSPEINLVRYLQSIRKYPILSQEEEFYLTSEYVRTKDEKLAYKLLTSHLRLVVKIVGQYRGYGLPVSEMIAEGNMGLLLALRKFDPHKGFRFSTYALWWIKATVQKYILNSWSLVKIGTTTAQKRLFFNLRKMKDKLNLMDDIQLSNDMINQIALSLDVSQKDVIDMNERMKAHDGSLNTLIKGDEEKGTEWENFIIDTHPNQEIMLGRREDTNRKRQIFYASLSCLNGREKDILIKRRLEEKAVTLEDLSAAYQISKERVRQIELNSIRKIQKYIAEAY